MTARDRLIASAIALIRCNGVAGTGIAQLLESSGIARRSIYLNFPGGKSELVASATVVAGQAISEAIERFAVDAAPAAVVEGFVALWRQTLIGSGFSAGCPVVAAALGGTESPAAADNAGTVFADWERLLAVRLEAANVAPETAARLATTVIAAIEGAVIMSLAAKSEAPLQRTGVVLVELIGQHARPASSEETSTADPLEARQ